MRRGRITPGKRPVSALKMKVGRMLRGYLGSLITSYAKVHLVGPEPPVMSI
jgi:hypothetical protein